jgi:IclR family KDG regulon transcriptional repressor
MAEASGTPVKSADRTLAILDLVAESGPIGFSEVADQLDLPKSSAHALLNTLEARGYLSFDPESRRYRLGTRIWELAHAHHEIEDLRSLMKPIMERLMKQTSETVQLAVLDDVSAVYLEVVESPHPMKLTSRPGSRLPAHMSAIGKSLLIGLEEQEMRERLSEVELVELTSHTITDRAELLAELEEARRNGYTTDDEEFAIGLRCVAMPVRDIDGRPVGAISVSMPTPRYSAAVAAEARKALAAAIEEAAQRLGRWQG